MTSESSKQKIGKIHDVFPSATKDAIAKILQYYEDDENEAIDALTRDGGYEALTNLTDSGSIKSKNNKNKKKKKKGRKETDMTGSTTASFDADDSSSLHSSGNIDAEVEKENSAIENTNGIQYSVTELKNASCERLHALETDRSSSTSKDCVPSKNVLEHEHRDDDDTSAPNPVCSSPVSDSSDKHDDSKKDKHRYAKEDSYGKHSSRQRTSSLRRSKTSSLSEESTNAHNPQNTAVPTKRGYEKCKKDLNRQSISLQRIHTQVVKGLEESSKKLKNSFNELRKLLDKRQEALEQELDKTKEDAFNLLKSRQDLAVELKRRVDRTSLTEAEWSELRLDVKQFVTERKYDDELGKTIWYQWSMDSITEIINTFGEVHPVKNVYSQRSHSALGNVVTSQSNPEPSPSSSPANEEISSSADKNVVDLMNEDHVDEETAVIKKEEAVPAPRTQPIENRSRIFSNRKFQNPNRGNKGYRGGNRGYGNPGAGNRNMGYRNSYYDYPNNYRNHGHQDNRDNRVHDNSANRVHDNSAYSNDRNMNSYRGNRGERRGGGQYKSGGGRYRGNMNQHRHNMDGVVKTEPTAPFSSAAAADSDKPTVVNGFENN